jgi:YD repeat-containing protein
VTLKSFDEDGSPSKGFFCKKSVSRDYRKIEMGSRSPVTAPSLLISEFNDNGKLVSTVDSSDISVTRVRYERDPTGKLLAVFSTVTSRDDDFINVITEEHFYSYDSKGLPEKMVVVKNGKDSSLILFSKDDRDNISIEKNTRTGKTYYYYYDDNDRLTDIVTENNITGKLLPDFLFEYDEKGRVSKMMNTEEGLGGNYYFWLYSYNEKDLRSEEKVYSRERTLLGRIEYLYK